MKIQDPFLAGKRAEAIAAVPDALVDEVALVGPRAHQGPPAGLEGGRPESNEVGTMLLSGVTVDSLRVVAEAVL